MVTEESKAIARAARLVEYMPDTSASFAGLPAMQTTVSRMHGDYREGFADGLGAACDILRGKFGPDDARMLAIEGFLARRSEETETVPY